MDDLLDDIFHSDDDRFEQIWLQDMDYNNLENKLYAKDLCKNADDFIAYMIWESQNWERMYAKHKPNTMVLRGQNPNIIFHGGCLGCLSQRKHGIDRCKGCQYFGMNGWDSPNLFIEGEDSAKLGGDEFKNFLTGE